MTDTDKEARAFLLACTVAAIVLLLMFSGCGQAPSTSGSAMSEQAQTRSSQIPSGTYQYQSNTSSVMEQVSFSGGHVTFSFTGPSVDQSVEYIVTFSEDSVSGSGVFYTSTQCWAYFIDSNSGDLTISGGGSGDSCPHDASSGTTFSPA